MECARGKAALLPKLVLKSENRHSTVLCGRDTASCMQLGALQGFGAMVDGLISRFRRLSRRKLKVICCGGLARVIKSYVRESVTVDLNHTIKSLALIYQDQVLSRLK